MAIELRLPRLSDEMKEATISRWLKSVGDPVEKGEPIAEVETEKVIVEVEATDGGTLIEILAPEQSVVQVDQPICVIGEAGEQPAPERSPARSVAEPAPVQPEPYAAPEPEPAEPPPPAVARHAPVRPSNVVHMAQRVPVREEAPRAHGGPQPPVSASPLARRVAEELGIDLTAVPGTGIGGKVVVADLQPWLSTEQAAPSGLLPPEAAVQPAPAHLVPTAGTTSATAPAPFVEQPHSQLRRTIARRMAESKASVPHFYMTAEIDVTEALALRQRLNERLEDGRISVNDLMIKAAALALEAVPALNASFTESAVHRYEAVHVGFATSIDEGLVTPVVRDCHLKSIGRIARETRGLIERARRRELSADEFQGGTFTISNLGMYEVVEFAAIIDPPQVGILAVARPTERPVVVDGRVVVRSMLNATLSADHRAVDGVTGAQFLQALKGILEQPERLML